MRKMARIGMIRKEGKRKVRERNRLREGKEMKNGNVRRECHKYVREETV